VTTEFQHTTVLVDDEARHGARLGVRSCHVEQPVEPSVVHDGVIVQEQEVASRRDARTKIAAAREPRLDRDSITRMPRRS